MYNSLCLSLGLSSCLLFPLSVPFSQSFCYWHLFGLSFFPASYSQYKSEDGRASSATRPSSAGSGQTYTPTLTPTPNTTPTPTRTTTSNSPSNNAATKTGKSLWHKGKYFSRVVIRKRCNTGLVLLFNSCLCCRLVALQQDWRETEVSPWAPRGAWETEWCVFFTCACVWQRVDCMSVCRKALNASLTFFFVFPGNISWLNLVGSCGEVPVSLVVT